MKKMIDICLIILLFLPISACGKDRPGQGRILVLGFSSKTISELQDRLLRESVMRELSKQEFTIVPVMEIERYFRENNASIRRVKPSQFPQLCNELDAAFSVNGTISSRSSVSVVKFVIYDAKNNKTFRYTIQLNSKIELDKYFKKVTNEIVTKIREIIPIQ